LYLISYLKHSFSQFLNSAFVKSSKQGTTKIVFCVFIL
jgi:hypothetical protein